MIYSIGTSVRGRGLSKTTHSDSLLTDFKRTGFLPSIVPCCAASFPITRTCRLEPLSSDPEPSPKHEKAGCRGGQQGESPSWLFGGCIHGGGPNFDVEFLASATTGPHLARTGRIVTGMATVCIHSHAWWTRMIGWGRGSLRSARAASA